MRYHDLVQLQDEMNRLFREARQWEASPPARPSLNPPLDICATPTGYRVRVDLPGTRRDDIRLTVQDGALTVAGHKAPAAEVEALRCLRCERGYGGFSRVIALPSDANLEAVAAALRRGVLEVSVPRRQPDRTLRIEVAVEV